jgi:exopolysaccharide production protein ExoZ
MDHSKPQLSPPRTSHALTSIQALRGFAVTLVVLFHVQHYTAERLQLPNLLPRFDIGAAGVDLFFVISGFIMVYASERLYARRGGMHIFFLRRMARIVPMYWAASTVLLVYLLARYGDLSAASGGGGAEYVVASYLFYPYVRPDGSGLPLLGVGWTLNYEAFFYALFGLSLVLPRRIAVPVIGALFALLIALRALYPVPDPFDFWFNPLILEFVFGTSIAMAYRAGLRLPMWLTWILVALGLATLAWSWREGHLLAPSSWWRILIWGLPALAIVGALALAERPVAKNLFWRSTGFLGDASYSIYLFHTLALGIPLIALGRFIAPASAPWLYVPCMLMAAVGLPILIYRFAERPLTAWLQRMIEKREAAQATAIAFSQREKNPTLAV